MVRVVPGLLLVFLVGCSGKPTTTEGSGRAPTLGSDPSPVMVAVKESTPVAGIATEPPKAVKPIPPTTGTENLTYRDVLELLRGRGLTVHMRSGGRVRTVQVYALGSENEALRAANHYSDGVLIPGAVVVDKHGSERAAHEYAGQYEDGIFEWGVFTVRGNDAETLNKFRTALLGK